MLQIDGIGLVAWIDDHPDSREAGHYVLEEFKPFGDQRIIPEHPDPSDIAAGPRDAAHEAHSDRVFDHKEDERNCSRGCAGRQDTTDRPGEDHVRLERDQLGSELGQACGHSPANRSTDVTL
jgi:hypothetical protein